MALDPEFVISRMKHLHLSKKELSDRCGFSRVTLDKILKGGEVNASTVEQLSKGLELEVGKLYNKDGSESSPKTVNALMRPHYLEGASAGSLNIVDSKSDHDMRPVNPGLPDYDYTIKVVGDSMEPEFRTNDIVACRNLDRGDFIRDGDVYVISTRDGVVIKRLKENHDTLTCISDNPKYESFDIRKDSDIFSIGRVVGSIRYY